MGGGGKNNVGISDSDTGRQTAATITRLSLSVSSYWHRQVT